MPAALLAGAPDLHVDGGQGRGRQDPDRTRGMAAPSRSASIGRATLPALFTTLIVTACAAQAPPSPQQRQVTSVEAPEPVQSNESIPAEAPTPQPSQSSPAGVTQITIQIGTESYSATLADNPTARDLASQLPLTLTFGDLNRVEKIAPLPRRLTTVGVPAGADPDINDIGYYRPSNDLVLYYGDVGYWDGIVRIGTLTEGMTSIAEQPEGFTATIARR